jgi:hypothetical protein
MRFVIRSKGWFSPVSLLLRQRVFPKQRSRVGFPSRFRSPAIKELAWDLGFEPNPGGMAALRLRRNPGQTSVVPVRRFQGRLYGT